VSIATVDVSSREAVLALVGKATGIGEIVGLIHSAGVSPSQARVFDTGFSMTRLRLRSFGIGALCVTVSMPIAATVRLDAIPSSAAQRTTPTPALTPAQGHLGGLRLSRGPE
jgi:hypothetical protein